LEAADVKSNDPDLDLLRNEAEYASTPTRREWAGRLLKRLTDLESARADLTASMTWPTTSTLDENRVDPEPDLVHPSSGAGDCS
jgi:hypothetical protein